MDRYARWNALLEMLTDSGRVSVEEAAGRLEVSQATIRRDFDQLAQQQMITRTRGGAVANGVSYDLPLRYKTAKHSAEKQRIGAAAAALVSPGTVVGLNGGTTSTEVARALAVRPDLNTSAEGAQLTVVTNALNIANELLVRSRMKVVVAGGVVRPKSFELVGPLGGALRKRLPWLYVNLVTAFLAAVAYRSWYLGGDDEVQDDVEDQQIVALAARNEVPNADLGGEGPGDDPEQVDPEPPRRPGGTR